MPPYFFSAFAGIQTVTLVDKKTILDYMRGVTDTANQIDITKFPGTVTKVSRAAPADEERVAKRAKVGCCVAAAAGVMLKPQYHTF